MLLKLNKEVKMIWHFPRNTVGTDTLLWNISHLRTIQGSLVPSQLEPPCPSRTISCLPLPSQMPALHWLIGKPLSWCKITQVSHQNWFWRSCRAGCHSSKGALSSEAFPHAPSPCRGGGRVASAVRGTPQSWNTTAGSQHVGWGGRRLHSSGVGLPSSLEEQDVSVHVSALSVGVNSHSKGGRASALSHFLRISSSDPLPHLPPYRSLLDTCRDKAGRNQFHCYRHYLKNIQTLIKSLWRNLCSNLHDSTENYTSSISSHTVV